MITKGAVPLKDRYLTPQILATPILDGTQAAGTVLWQIRLPFNVKVWRVLLDLVAGTAGSGAVDIDYRRPGGSWTTMATIAAGATNPSYNPSTPIVLPEGTEIRVVVDTAGGTGLRYSVAIAFVEAHPLETQS